jgi:recombinational DNA repair ATPase RecF
MTKKKPVLLIDDLISELDDNHKNMLLKKIEYYQTFISLISKMALNKDLNKNRNLITI